MRVLPGFKKVKTRLPSRKGTGKYPWAEMKEGSFRTFPISETSAVVSSVRRWNWLNKACLRIYTESSADQVVVDCIIVNWPFGAKHIARPRK